MRARCSSRLLHQRVQASSHCISGQPRQGLANLAAFVCSGRAACVSARNREGGSRHAEEVCAAAGRTKAGGQSGLCACALAQQHGQLRVGGLEGLVVRGDELPAQRTRRGRQRRVRRGGHRVGLVAWLCRVRPTPSCPTAHCGDKSKIRTARPRWPLTSGRRRSEARAPPSAALPSTPSRPCVCCSGCGRSLTDSDGVPQSPTRGWHAARPFVRGGRRFTISDFRSASIFVTRAWRRWWCSTGGTRRRPASRRGPPAPQGTATAGGRSGADGRQRPLAGLLLEELLALPGSGLRPAASLV